MASPTPPNPDDDPREEESHSDDKGSSHRPAIPDAQELLEQARTEHKKRVGMFTEDVSRGVLRATSSHLFDMLIDWFTQN